MLIVSCPKCGKSGNAPDRFVGQRIKCRQCSAAFFVGQDPDKDKTTEPAKRDGSRGSGLSRLDIARNALDMVPESVARENAVLPIHLKGNKLRIAMADASDGEMMDKLKFILNCDIEAVAAPRSEIDQAIDRWYGPADKKASPPEPLPKAAERPATLAPSGMVPFFESSRPSGNGTCSDDGCPCGWPGASLPPGTGFLYISQAVVDFRKDALSESEATKKLVELQKATRATIANPNALASPLLICKLGATKRGINLAVAGPDAKHWWKTGQVPLRPTPLLVAPSREEPEKKEGQAKLPEKKTPVPGPKAWRQRPLWDKAPVFGWKEYAAKSPDGREPLHDPSLDFSIRYYQSSHNTNAKNVDALAKILAALAALKGGSPTKATAELTSVVQMSDIAPQLTAKALQIRGILRATDSELVAAIEDLTASLEKNSSEDADRAWSLLWRGRANARVGDANEAIADFTTAAGINILKTIPYLEAIRSTAELDLKEVLKASR